MPTKIKNKRKQFLIMIAITLATYASFTIKKNDVTKPAIPQNLAEGVIVSSRQPVTYAPQDIETADDIADCWKNIRAGDRYFKIGDYASAAEAYKKAYSTTNGSKAISGLWLARTYEQLQNYDEGIATLNDMIKNRVLSEKGVRNAAEIRTRLLAAKQAANQKLGSRLIEN